MVEFLIKELEIEAADADMARKDPEAYQINYQTYKLFEDLMP